MELLDSQLVVKKSTLPGAGKGLFTKIFIPKGAFIVEYKGKVSSWKEAEPKEGFNGYIYYITRNTVIDAMGDPEAIARYANDAKGISKVKGISNNAAYHEEGKRVFIVAKKDIPKGSEIFVDYGKEYWDVVKFNIKLQKEEEKEAAAKKAATEKKSSAKKKTSKKASGTAKKAKKK
ncbi:SET domain-containing protein [Gynurincola endophyticus]|uniref:SET domain-containing protein n=1 Tax=Gynurincola endophyticus TaxID=2479004 RepID=UPI000F8DE7A8|nr:SET domain-containing protein [Gynurincola endophyticus]